MHDVIYVLALFVNRSVQFRRSRVIVARDQVAGLNVDAGNFAVAVYRGNVEHTAVTRAVASFKLGRCGKFFVFKSVRDEIVNGFEARSDGAGQFAVFAANERGADFFKFCGNRKRIFIAFAHAKRTVVRHDDRFGVASFNCGNHALAQFAGARQAVRRQRHIVADDFRAFCVDRVDVEAERADYGSLHLMGVNDKVHFGTKFISFCVNAFFRGGFHVAVIGKVGDVDQNDFFGGQALIRSARGGNDKLRVADTAGNIAPGSGD